MENMDMRLYARGKGVFNWQIADRLGVSEPTVTRKLRHKFSDAQKNEWRLLIDGLAAKLAGEVER